MSTTVKEIIKIIEGVAPKKYAEKWDNCGLLVGEETQKVDKVLLALSPTFEVIDEAINRGVDLLICHHPLTISGEKQVNNSTVFGRKALKAIKNNLGIYGAHTNFDAAQNGINDYLASLLGIEHIKPLLIIEESIGLGRVGYLDSEITLKALADKVKTVLNLDYIRYSGEDDRVVSKVAICSGSGMSLMEDVLSVQADVYITGDIRYHGAIDALEAGVALIDATHFGSENIVSELFGKLLAERFEGLNIIKDDFSKDPIKIDRNKTK